MYPPKDFAELLQLRALARRAIEDYFDDLGFLPVEAPILVLSPGTEVHLNYFKTEWQDHQGKLHPLYLRSSPELHMKQSLSCGLRKIYHLGKAFRSGGELSPWHHPEFTMLEWYDTGIDYMAFMDQTYDLIRHVHSSLRTRRKSPIRPALPSVSRITVYEAFSDWAKIELLDQDPELAFKARRLGYHSVREDDDFETAFFKILIDIIEPRLKKEGAVFLYDYPPSQAALANIHDNTAKRFELYLDGIEICNAFEELLSPADNRARIDAANSRRKALNKEAIPIDEDFLKALDRGIAPCCGNAMGFDRLLAYLLQLPSIHDLIPFRQNQPYGPHLQ